MANQNDSFIDEVSDELRRDRLFRLMRRYGWIVIVVIVGVVAATAWREYTASRDRAAAQAWGDAILAAEDDPQAILAVDAQGAPGRQVLAALLAAGARVEAGDPDGAAADLRVIAEADDQGALAELAQLKLVMLQGAAMDASERDAILTRLSRAGAPFELLALEQKAVALVDAGRTQDAITLIRQIQDRDGMTEALRRRLSEMMIALGAEPRPAG